MSETDKTAPQRVARHARKKKAAGWRRVYVWAKSKEDRDRILEFADALKQKDE